MLTREDALRLACDALRAAGVDPDRYTLETASDVASLLTTSSIPWTAQYADGSPHPMQAAVTALCALRCVLDGYRVDEPTGPPPPRG